MEIAKEPCAVGDKLVRSEVDAWLSQHIAVGVKAIHLHSLICLVAKDSLKHRTKVCQRGFLSTEIGLRCHLHAVATNKQRHLLLMTVNISIGRILGKEVAIKTISCQSARLGLCQQLVGTHLAGLGNVF